MLDSIEQAITKWVGDFSKSLGGALFNEALTFAEKAQAEAESLVFAAQVASLEGRTATAINALMTASQRHLDASDYYKRTSALSVMGRMQYQQLATEQQAAAQRAIEMIHAIEGIPLESALDSGERGNTVDESDTYPPLTPGYAPEVIAQVPQVGDVYAKSVSGEIVFDEDGTEIWNIELSPETDIPFDIYKGDVVGHPFHGNQWSEVSQTLGETARGITDNSRKGDREEAWAHGQELAKHLDRVDAMVEAARQDPESSQGDVEKNKEKLDAIADAVREAREANDIHSKATFGYKEKTPLDRPAGDVSKAISMVQHAIDNHLANATGFLPSDPRSNEEKLQNLDESLRHIDAEVAMHPHPYEVKDLASISNGLRTLGYPEAAKALKNPDTVAGVKQAIKLIGETHDTTASKGVEGSTLAERAMNLHKDSVGGGDNGDYEPDTEHINLANDHHDTATRLRQEAETATSNDERVSKLLGAKYHDAAATAHEAAAIASNHAIQANINDDDNADEATDKWITASKEATDASARAEKFAPTSRSQADIPKDSASERREYATASEAANDAAEKIFDPSKKDEVASIHSALGQHHEAQWATAKAAGDLAGAEKHKDASIAHAEASVFLTPEASQKAADLTAETEKVAKGDVPGHEFHGNQWSAAMTSRVISAVMENGGATISNIGRTPMTGFIVATDPKLGKVVDGEDFRDLDKARQILGDYIFANKETLRGDNKYLGLWHNTNGGADEVHIDIVERIGSRTEAIQAGRARNQISIWDLNRSEEIPTGGTGSEKS
jgi:hypothetical protein